MLAFGLKLLLQIAVQTLFLFIILWMTLFHPRWKNFRIFLDRTYTSQSVIFITGFFMFLTFMMLILGKRSLMFFVFVIKKNRKDLLKFKISFFAQFLISKIGWNRKQQQFLKFFEIFGTWQKWISRCFQGQKFIFWKNKVRNRKFIVLWTLLELTFSVSYRNGKKWKKLQKNNLETNNLLRCRKGFARLF